ncbi:MAG TPA: patatin-like phospholipase family protein [Candidatus Edwardsbacteria bacterium]|nr:patatin-like phospholipase family protein [Candidatus Edwardsbacteria bacterium]
MAKKIGLALSGGVGYCLAHIGVLKLIEEQGIKVDCVAGTSGGALIGTMYASGIDPVRMEQIASTISWNKLMAPTRVLMNKGLVSSEPIERLVDELIGKGRRFSELKLPLSVVAVDLISGGEVVFPMRRDELIAPAVRASCSVPVVFGPVKMGQWLLSDGGIKAPLPVEALRTMKVDAVIGVVFATGRYEPKNLFEIGVRSMNLATDVMLELYEEQLDVLIRVDAGEISNWDLKAALTLIDVGYQAAARQLHKLKEIAAA